MIHEHEARIHDAARRLAHELREEALDRAWRRVAGLFARAPRTRRVGARPVEA